MANLPGPAKKVTTAIDWAKKGYKWLEGKLVKTESFNPTGTTQFKRRMVKMKRERTAALKEYKKKHGNKTEIKDFKELDDLLPQGFDITKLTPEGQKIGDKFYFRGKIRPKGEPGPVAEDGKKYRYHILHLNGSNQAYWKGNWRVINDVKKLVHDSGSSRNAAQQGVATVDRGAVETADEAALRLAEFELGPAWTSQIHKNKISAMGVYDWIAKDLKSKFPYTDGNKIKASFRKKVMGDRTFKALGFNVGGKHYSSLKPGGSVGKDANEVALKIKQWYLENRDNKEVINTFFGKSDTAHKSSKRLSDFLRKSGWSVDEKTSPAVLDKIRRDINFKTAGGKETTIEQINKKLSETLSERLHTYGLTKADLESYAGKVVGGENPIIPNAGKTVFGNYSTVDGHRVYNSAIHKGEQIPLGTFLSNILTPKSSHTGKVTNTLTPTRYKNINKKKEVVEDVKPDDDFFINTSSLGDDNLINILKNDPSQSYV